MGGGQNLSFTDFIPIIKFNDMSTKEIETIIKSLKTKNSYGYDEISVKILKLSALFINSPLAYICNKAHSSGIFPHRLKFSVAKPVFKNDVRLSIFILRPISLLTSFSIFEMLYKTLFHINQNNILVNEHCGFSSSSSTENASYKLVNDILLGMHNQLTAGGIFGDSEKAFSCVSHNILLSKLEFYGTTDKFNALIKSCLKGRHQRVLTHRSTQSRTHLDCKKSRTLFYKV